MRAHLAIYGTVQMVRAWCGVCKRQALVVDNQIQCCGREAQRTPVSVKRISEPESRRKKPSTKHSKLILETQNYRCLYCDIDLLNGWAWYHKKLCKVRLTWDHQAPYTYTLDNRPENFAASCQFCNAWKAAHIFKTVDEVRIYVTEKWDRERQETL